MLIRGGSAVMGLVSIVEVLQEGTLIPAIKLFHSNRSNKDIPFYSQMQKLVCMLYKNFRYLLNITGRLEDGKSAQGQLCRTTLHHLVAKELASRHSTLMCCMWKRSILRSHCQHTAWFRSLAWKYLYQLHYKSEPARWLEKLKTSTNGSQEKQKRLESCADGMSFSITYCMDILLPKLCKALTVERPAEYPLDFLSKAIIDATTRLQEVANVNAMDPDFGLITGKLTM